LRLDILHEDQILRSEIIHARFGHLSPGYLRRAGFSSIVSKEEFCPSCSAGKLVRRKKNLKVNYPKTQRVHGKYPLDILHLDTAGPFTSGLGGIRYFVIAVCDKTGFIGCTLAKNKVEIVSQLKDEVLTLSQKANRRVRGFFSDNGTEFINRRMDKFATEENIFQQFRSAHFPSENGKAERAIRSIKTIARTMLITSGLGRRFWGFAILYAVEILNVFPKQNEEESPFEKLFGYKPDYTRFKIFGAMGHGLIHNRRPFQPLPKIIFLDFSKTNKTYVTWVKKQDRIHQFRDISVDEIEVIRRQKRAFRDSFKDFQKKKKAKTQPQQIQEENIIEVEEEITDTQTPIPTPIRTIPENNNSMEVEESQSEREEVESSEQQENNITTSTRNFCDVHEDNIIEGERRDNSARIATVDDGMDYYTSIAEDEDNPVFANVLRTSTHELKPPRKWDEIKFRADKKLWEEAYQKEIDSLENVGGMVVVDCPEDKEVLDLLTIFTWKDNSFTGEREAKVRMAGRGDKAEIKLSLYSPVGGATGMRLIVHVSVTYFDRRLNASDIKTAFLNARTKEPRYFNLPRGHILRRGLKKVWKTFCALYGLADSSFHWYQCLIKYLKDIGLQACSSEECLFIKKNSKDELILMVLIYVDDLLFTGTKEELNWFCNKLEERFKIRKTIDVNSFIGMQIIKYGKGYKLFQEKFIIDVVDKFQLKEAKKVLTPIELNCLENFESKVLEDKTLYQSIIGSLNYLTNCTRPDIAFAVNLLARRMQAPTQADLRRAKRVIVYLRETAKDGIIIEPSHYLKKTVIKTYVDASLGNGQGRKSIFGFISMIGNNIISFKSKKQKIVAQSSCEAEYIAMAYAIKETLWIERLLTEVGIDFDTSIIYCDNMGAIKIAQKQASTGRTKHLDIRLQMIKDLVAKEEMKIQYVQSSLNIADIFTKPLGRLLFSRVAEAIMNKKKLDSKEEC